MELLRVNNLKTYFFTHEGIVKAVDGVSFKIDRGETMGLVGESGCGKSVTALSIMRLIQNPPGKIVEGEIYFEGRDLLKMSEKEMRKIRGNKISMIFQEPMTSLDPVFTIGNEIMETIQLHQGLGEEEAREKTIDMLKIVGIPEPEKRMNEYPHMLSGGMRQRAMIAMALSCNPALLIADEPTTALDVTIQAQILRLIENLKEDFDASVLLITHNLGVIAETCDNVAVMYAGNIMEYTDVETLFDDPLHPYTKGLSRSTPRLDRDVEHLEMIEGSVPNLLDTPSGCPFHPRCEFCTKRCVEVRPELCEVEDGHLVRCHLAGREGENLQIR
jgi:peptide/nickel transport system ATP-binding protein/oligopeptide transport system ATP-binding protein